MISRRGFIKNSGGSVLLFTAVGSAAFFTESCNLASALNEANNIIKLVAPLGDGVAAIVEVADPPLAIAVAGADKLYDAGVVAVENLLSSWATASAAAQPGILAQTQAAIVNLQSNVNSLIVTAQVKNPTSLAEIGTITGAMTSEISALLTIIPQIGALGGTTTALSKVVQKHGLQLANHRSAKTWRGNLVKQMNTPTGTAIDAPRTVLAAKLQALDLK